MKKALMLVLTGALVVGASTLAVAQRRDNPKVTGGGQILTSNSSSWDTLTFYGEDVVDRGQVQYVGTGTPEESAVDSWHGIVNCVHIEGNKARLSGTSFNASTRTSATFWLEVIDMPAGNNNADPIRLKRPAGTGEDCNEEDPTSPQNTSLGRGEAVVHNP